MITRSDLPLRVINSSPEAIAKAKKRARLSFRQIRTENIFNKTLILMGLIMVILVLGTGWYLNQRWNKLLKR